MTQTKVFFNKMRLNLTLVSYFKGKRAFDSFALYGSLFEYQITFWSVELYNLIQVNRISSNLNQANYRNSQPLFSNMNLVKVG